MGLPTWREASEDAELVRREAGYLSCAIVSLVNLFDLNRIVLGGDIVENGEPLARMIEEEVNGRIITNNHIVVCLCRPVDKAAVAASIALNSLFRLKRCGWPVRPVEKQIVLIN